MRLPRPLAGQSDGAAGSWPAAPPASAVVLATFGLGVWALGLYLAPLTVVWLAPALGLGVPALWLLWLRPELGLLGFLFLTSGFIAPDAVELRLPVGGLETRDLLLLAMLAITAIRSYLEGRRLELPWWRVSGPLLVLLAVGLYSALYALAYQGVAPNWALGELRAVVYYATFFVVVWAVKTRRQLRTVLFGLFLLADLTAGVIILQQFLGVDNRLLAAMTGGDWEVWQVEGLSGGFGAVRVLPAGHALTYAVSIVAFALLLMGRQAALVRAALAAQFVYLNFGLLLTYTRAQWLASMVALALVVWFVSRSDKARLARYVMAAGLTVPLAYALFSTGGVATVDDEPFLTAFAARALTLVAPTETLGTDSLRWRAFETEKALTAIAEQPFLGVGLGNAYRDATLLRGEARSGGTRLTRYVHNSYLYVTVKMGLLGLLALLWFSGAFVVSGWRAFAALAAGTGKALMLAVLASFVGLLVWSFTHAQLLSAEGTAVVGLLAGLAAAAERCWQPPALACLAQGDADE